MKFTSSKGDLSGHITDATLAPDGLHFVFNVDLTDPSFNGTNFSVSVSKIMGGDGQAIIRPR